MLLEKLQEQLLTHEVTFKEADYLSIFDSVYKENQDKYFKEFVKLLSTFINLFKSSGYEADQFEEFVQQNQTKPDIPFLKGGRSYSYRWCGRFTATTKII